MLICPICKVGVLILNKHHIVPRSYGGPEDGPLLELCENCHKGIHYTAEQEFGSKATVDKKHLEIYLLPDQLKRARPYIEAIKQSKAVYIKIGKARGTVLKKLAVDIPEDQLIKCHKRKASLGFSSLEKYLKHLIEKDIKSL